MKLMFAITREGDDEVTRLTSADQEITAGSDSAAAITLKGLAPKVFTIERLDDGVMVFERHQDDIPILIDGDELTKDSIHVRNGSEIDIGDYKILLTVNFDRAAYSSRNSLAVMLSAGLIVTILLGEALVVHWLPKKIHTSELWGAEVLRQSTLHSLDQLRNHIRAHANKDTHDPLLAPTLRLYKNETDRLADYARLNQTRMSIKQLKRLDKDIKRLKRQVFLLTSGKLIPPARTLDTKPAVESLVKEKEK